MALDFPSDVKPLFSEHFSLQFVQHVEIIL